MVARLSLHSSRRKSSGAHAHSGQSHVDDAAGRSLARRVANVRALGFPAPGTYGEFVKLSSIKEVKGQPVAEQMIKHLVQGHEAVIKTARSLFSRVEDASDEPTADLLTQRMQIHEKTAWMLRSLLE